MHVLPLARGGRIPLRHVLVMGILNATPDSFSDGGDLTPGNAADRARAMLAAGADLLDVGGESTRPGHAQVPASDEAARVVPVLEAIRAAGIDAPISVDTRKATVARAALAAGASLLNDVEGGADAAMLELARTSGCAIVLMRHRPVPGEVVEGARAQLGELLATARRAGLRDEQVVLDPGIGFGDPPGGDPQANLALVRSAGSLGWGRPVLVGASRKRFIGVLSKVERPAERVAGSVAVALIAAQAGAAIVRVHDVAETVQALRVAGFHP